MIRLLAFDLDGTAITEHKYLSPGNREALIRAAERGIILCPATGRMRDFIPADILSLPGARYAITSNGAAVYYLETGTPLFERLIPNEIAQQVQAILDGYEIYVEYYREGRAITRRGYPEISKTRFGFPREKWHFVESKEYTLIEDFGVMLRETGLCPEKVNLPYLPGVLRAELWGKLSAISGIRLTSSIPDNIEVNAQNAHKGAALLELADRLSIPREEVFAIGDNGNDVTMLEAAGCSVCVGDGSPEALAAAKYKTAPHDRDGLAAAIARFILL